MIWRWRELNFLLVESRELNQSELIFQAINSQIIELVPRNLAATLQEGYQIPWLKGVLLTQVTNVETP